MKTIYIKLKPFKLFGLFITILVSIIIFRSWSKKQVSEVLVKKSCLPQTNILFLKTHKTASTTIRSILLRFAAHHQLLLAMPSYRYYLRFSKTFNRNMLLDFKPGYHQNIFSEHVRFDYKEMKSVMAEGTTFITILRDPVSEFESLYTFLDLDKFYKMDFSTFSHLDTTDAEWSKVKYKRAAEIYGPNQMSFDLGIDPELFDDDDAMLREIERLDRQFDLVMITELMDESLILLKDKLCWSNLDDVVTLKLNQRPVQLKHRLSVKQIENLRRINRADQIVYDYFYKKFQTRLKKFGLNEMEAQVKQLKLNTQQLYDVCVEEVSNSKENSRSRSRIQEIRRKNSSSGNALCNDINQFDFFYVLELYKKQKQYYDITDETATILDILSFIASTVKYIFNSSFKN